MIHRVRIMVYNDTFNNSSVISWWSVLLAEETGVPRGNHRPSVSYRQTYHIMLYRVHLVMISSLSLCECECCSERH